MILQSFIVFLPAILAGSGLVHLVWKNDSAAALGLKIFLGMGVGLGITSCIYFLRLLLFPGQSGYFLLETLLLILILIALFLKKRFSLQLFDWPHPISRIQILSVLAVVLVGAAAVYFLIVYARLAPHGDYDAQAIWNMRARFIYRLGDAWQNAFSPLINRNFHMDYPLLVPLSVVGGWNTLGEEVQRVPSMLSWVFLFGMGGALYSAMTILRTNSQAAMATIILLATPGLLIFSTFQTADIPLTYFFLVSTVVIILAYRENSPGLLSLAGLLAGLSAWTKNEGIPFVILLLISIVVFFDVRKNRSSLFSFLIGIAFPIVTVVLFKIVVPRNNDLFTDNGIATIFSKLIDPARYIQIFTHLLSELLHLGNWPISIVIVLLVYAAIMGTKKSGRVVERVMWIVPLSQFMIYMLIYLITPHDLEWHLNYSMSRLLIHLFPMALCSFFLVVNTPESVLNKVK